MSEHAPGPARGEFHAFGLRSPVLRSLIGAAARWPARIISAWVVVLVVTAPGLAQLKFETTASSLLNRSGPDWARYQASIAEFGGDEVIVAAIEGDRPFDPEVIDEIGRITDALEGMPGIRRVDSVFTMPIVRASGDTLVLDPAIEGAAPRTPDEIERTRRLLERDRIAPRMLMSEDGRVFTVSVMLDDDVGEQQASVVESVFAALGETPGWISGVPIFETQVGARTLRELALFVPMTLALIVGLLAMVFRSALAVAVPLATSIAGAWLTLSLMGVLGEPITMLAMLLPSVLFALGCAYVMHLLTAVRGVRGVTARVHAMTSVAPPIALSGLTTAVGFFAMSTVDVDAIRALGVYGGLGTLVTVFAALTLAPALLLLRPDEQMSGDLDERIGRFGRDRLLPLLVRRRGVVLATWLALLMATGAGLGRLEIETDGAHWWPHGSPVRDAFEAIRVRLSGISPMNVSIRSLDGGLVTEPAVLSSIDRLSSYVAGLDGVGKSISIADPLRQIHGGFNDDPTLPLPDNQPMIEQYLMMLESVEHTHDLVSRDRLAANVVIRADNNGSRDLLEVARQADSWWQVNGAAGFEAKTTGIMFEFARAEDAIAWGQIRGLGIALGCIAALLLLIFRHPATAAAALVPNVIPLVVIFGSMGLLATPLDAGTVCLGCLALGIAVDDTIHFVIGFRVARDRGQSRAEAIGTTLHRVLPALVYTTAAIGFGFAVLGLSGFTLTRNLGVVTTGLVVLCLAADVTLLPALLLARSPEGNRARS